MSLRLFAARAAPTPAMLAGTRAFASSAVRGDIVQDLYLSNLKGFTPAPKPADAHVGLVREFSAPTAPAAPESASSAGLASELDAYAASEPDHADAPTADGASDAGLSISAYLKEAAKPIVLEQAHH